jgi:hypothetical protein
MAHEPVNRSDLADILARARPVVGRSAWGVGVGWGSFLTMEFGAPVWRRLGDADEEHAHGEWHLWIQHAVWRLEQDGTVIAASEDDRSTLEAAVARLEGRELRDVQVSPPALDTAFVFDGGCVLRVLPATTTRYEHWLLFAPDGHVLVVGPGTAHTYDRADAPPRHSEWDDRHDEARVSFRVLGDAVQPAQLTRRLGVPPTLTATKGQPDPRRPERLARRTAWVLDSPLPPDRPLADHIEALAGALEPRRAVLRRLARNWSAYVSFLCSLSSDATNYNLSLPADLLRRIDDLGAGLDLSFWTG